MMGLYRQGERAAGSEGKRKQENNRTRNCAGEEWTKVASNAYAIGITSKSMEETNVNGRQGNTRKTIVGRSKEKAFECVCELGLINNMDSGKKAVGCIEPGRHLASDQKGDGERTIQESMY